MIRDKKSKVTIKNIKKKKKKRKSKNSKTGEISSADESNQKTVLERLKADQIGRTGRWKSA